MEIYSGLSAAATFICGITTNIVTAIILGVFENSLMAKPYLCIFKAMGDLPFLAMIFLQQQSFTISMVGIFGSYLFGKGWSSTAINML